MINPTISSQPQVREVINNIITLIPSVAKWKHNPTAPSIKSLIKLHKPEQPIARWSIGEESQPTN